MSPDPVVAPPPPSTTSTSPEPALALAWRYYRELDATSVQSKKRWLWVKRALLLPSILCIVLLPVSKILLPHLMKDSNDAWLSGLSWVSGIMVALTAFINQIVGPDPNQRWIRARAAAETVKSEVFRFVGGAAPYDKVRDGKVLISRLTKLLEPVKNLIPISLSEEARASGRPPASMNREAYLAARVDDQLAFFTKKAQDCARDALRVKWWTWILGGLVVIAGVSAPFLPQDEMAGWITILTALSVTLATQLYLGRNEFQASLYQSACSQLDVLKATWLMESADDASQQAKYVGLFEEEISRINGAWLSEWIGKPEDKQGGSPPEHQTPHPRSVP